MSKLSGHGDRTQRKKDSWYIPRRWRLAKEFETDLPITSPLVFEIFSRIFLQEVHVDVEGCTTLHLEGECVAQGWVGNLAA